MRFLRNLRSRVRSLFDRERTERDLSDELEDYIQRQTERHLAHGFSPDEARAAGIRDVGGVEQLKEECRDARGTAFVENFLRDLRYGLRVHLKNRGFFTTSAMTLALGIGVATTLFSVVESQLWRPFPFPDSKQLAVLFERNLKQKWQQSGVSVPDFADWRQRNHAFESLAAMEFGKRRNFAANGFHDRPEVSAISFGFFETLRVKPQAGRTFDATDEQPRKQTEAILSGDLARRAFGSPNAAIGKTIKLDGEPFLVTGVLPDGFRLDFFETADVYLPLEVSYGKSREARDLAVVGRRRSGVSLSLASADMEGVARAIAAEHPETNANFSAMVWNLGDMIDPATRAWLLFSFAFSVFVLLIACANVAGLQLMRSVVRQREFAVREALGASRLTLLRQAIAESAWIASAGAGFGILLAMWSIRALRSLPLESMLPRESELLLDGWSVAFAVAISAGATFLFGLAPRLSKSAINLETALRDSGRSASSSMGARFRIEFLAAAQVALAFISLFGAGLFVVSNWDLQQIPLGFHPDGLWTMQISLSGTNYSNESQIKTFYKRVAAEASTTPDVRKFALSNSIPLSGGSDVKFVRADEARPAHGQEPFAIEHAVTPEYFDVLQIPLLQGRGFDVGDSDASPRVAIVNENFVQHHFPGENPIGKRLLILENLDSAAREGIVEIVGVTANVRDVGLDEVPFDDLYFSLAQIAPRAIYVTLKSSAPASVAPLLRRKFQHLDADQFVSDPKPLESYATRARHGGRLNLWLIAIFADLSLLLTAVALYGTVSFAVAQRTREIGIRMALGAQRSSILGLTLGRVLRLSVAGSICGFCAAFVIGSLLGNALYMVPQEHNGVLYQVSLHDPLSFTCAALVVLVCAAVAGLAPAVRAARIDPHAALRCE
ncbi:MAG: ABC transporter permease [Bryobacteraceae bacterium]